MEFHKRIVRPSSSVRRHHAGIPITNAAGLDKESTMTRLNDNSPIRSTADPSCDPGTPGEMVSLLEFYISTH